MIEFTFEIKQSLDVRGVVEYTRQKYNKVLFLKTRNFRNQKRFLKKLRNYYVRNKHSYPCPIIRGNAGGGGGGGGEEMKNKFTTYNNRRCRFGPVCAGAAGDAATAQLVWRQVDETSSENRWRGAERDMVGSFVTDGKRTVARELRRTTAADDCRRICRLVAYEVLYVKYGAVKWPAKTLHAVLAGKRRWCF